MKTVNTDILIIGGRINTLYSNELPALEMGATWLGKKHTALVQLLKELNISIYPQLMSNKAIYEADARSAAQLVFCQELNNVFAKIDCMEALNITIILSDKIKPNHYSERLKLMLH